MAGLIPSRIDVLHVAVEAAELGQKLCLVQVSLPVLNVSLYAGPLIKPAIRVLFSFVDSLAEEVIVFNPSAHLLIGLVFFQPGYRENVDGTVENVVLSPRKEEDFNV